VRNVFLHISASEKPNGTIKKKYMASDIFISETNNICISKRLQCQSPIFHIFFEKMNRTKIVNWLQIRIFFDTMFCDMVSNLVCCNIQHSSEWETMVNYLEEMVNKNIQRHSPSVQGDFAQMQSYLLGSAMTVLNPC